jgi:uncharacterized protein GlcG (DUF336 family)
VPVKAIFALAGALLIGACSGGGGGSSGCGDACAVARADALTQGDVQTVIAQAVAEAQARSLHAHVAVVDRMGNVLAVFSMPGAPSTIAISSGLGVVGGLDGIQPGTIPATLAAITKAVTGAYLSSGGNAFTTRTAGQIIQEHFNPGESQQPSGPLYGVQFSQLTCSDINRHASDGSTGPKRSPLGLAADPGGLPIYKNGVLAGGIGIEADGLYSFDRDIDDIDTNDEELVAVAGTRGFAAADDIRGNRITADGRSFRYVDSEATLSGGSQVPSFASLAGALVAVPGYNAATIIAGVAYGSPASGVRADTAEFAAQGGWILVDAANANRYPLIGGVAQFPGADTLKSDEVKSVLSEALAIAQRTRGQIRRPLGSSAQVTITVVDIEGNVLGLVRTADGPLFGIDVAVQKARTAIFFSEDAATSRLLSLLPARHIQGPTDVSVAQYVLDARAFLGDPNAFTGQTAWTSRAIGNLHRPYYPDGLDTAPSGPFSTPIARWSPFNVGLQLDIVYNQFIRGILGDTSIGCGGKFPAGSAIPPNEFTYPELRNGIQIFPGGVPIYRGARLIGAIGVSGDGVDQDDMVAFLGLANASRKLATGMGNAPAAMRADQLVPHGVRLRYVQCPQAPFTDSTDQNVCAGL